MRTVSSFGNEQYILKLFQNNLQKPKKIALAKAIKAGLAFGFSQIALFIVYGVTFIFGAFLFKKSRVDMIEMFIAIFAIMFAAFGSGTAS